MQAAYAVTVPYCMIDAHAAPSYAPLVTLPLKGSTEGASADGWLGLRSIERTWQQDVVFDEGAVLAQRRACGGQQRARGGVRARHRAAQTSLRRRC